MPLWRNWQTQQTQNPISIFSGFEYRLFFSIALTAYLRGYLIALVERTCSCFRFFYHFSTDFSWFVYKLTFDSKSACDFQ